MNMCCPACGEEFKSEVWHDGECPKCGNEYTWEEVYNDDNNWCDVQWDKWNPEEKEMSSKFKFDIGQEVWFVGEEKKASTGKVVKRIMAESDDYLSIEYSVDEEGDHYQKYEEDLFVGPDDLVNSFFSEKSGVANFATDDGSLIVSDNHIKLHDLCGRFIDENHLTCGEAIWQHDGMEENAREFIQKICELIGYHEPEEDSGNGE